MHLFPTLAICFSSLGFRHLELLFLSLGVLLVFTAASDRFLLLLLLFFFSAKFGPIINYHNYSPSPLVNGKILDATSMSADISNYTFKYLPTVYTIIHFYRPQPSAVCSAPAINCGLWEVISNTALLGPLIPLFSQTFLKLLSISVAVRSDLVRLDTD